jgi:hypothetical protein
LREAVDQHESEARQLNQEIIYHEAELAYLREDDTRHLPALEEAEHEAMAYYQELDAMIAAHQEAESQHCTLLEERKEAELSESELHQWVQQVQAELKEARTENGQLSSRLEDLHKHKQTFADDHKDQKPLKEAGFDAKRITDLLSEHQEHEARKESLQKELRVHQPRIAGQAKRSPAAGGRSPIDAERGDALSAATPQQRSTARSGYGNSSDTLKTPLRSLPTSARAAAPLPSPPRPLPAVPTSPPSARNKASGMLPVVTPDSDNDHSPGHKYWST